MKKWLWGLLIIVLVFLLGAVVYIWLKSENRPEGTPGPQAEQMAQQIYNAVNKEAWDSLAFVGWTFQQENTYLWDKQNNWVEVRWDNFKVLLDPVKVSGKAYMNKREVKGVQADDLINDAYNMYCNDGFWFHAFTKLHDPGTTRSLVEKDGEKALLVTYAKGGVSPGDAYLWYTDSKGLPAKFEIWASILPVKGMDYTWENWDSLYNGALYAIDHKSDVLNVQITNVISGPDLSSIGRDPGIFSPLSESE